MGSLRTFLRRFAGVVLACQVTALAAAPIGLAQGDVRGEHCECPGGMAGLACPMHSSPNRDDKPEPRCTMRSASPLSDAALVSLGLGLALLPPTLVVDRAEDVQFLPSLSSIVIDRPTFLHSPPPKA